MTEQKLRPCPFCNKLHKIIKLDYGRGIQKDGVDIECLIGDYDGNVTVTVEEYNTRPLESALQTELDKVIVAERKKSLLADERGVELNEVNHGFVIQQNAAVAFATKLSTLKQAVKEVVEEIETAENKYKDVFNGKTKSPNPKAPKEYWEGLVSGLMSAQITLHKHGLIPEEE